MSLFMLPIFCMVLLSPSFPPSQKSVDPVAIRERDLIYGRKYGLSLTMDRFVPRNPNGKAVVLVISGGWFSSDVPGRVSGFRCSSWQPTPIHDSRNP